MVSPRAPGSGATARYDGGVKVGSGCNVHITSHAVLFDGQFRTGRSVLCPTTTCTVPVRGAEDTQSATAQSSRVYSTFYHFSEASTTEA